MRIQHNKNKINSTKPYYKPNLSNNQEKLIAEINFIINKTYNRNLLLSCENISYFL